MNQGAVLLLTHCRLLGFAKLYEKVLEKTMQHHKFWCSFLKIYLMRIILVYHENDIILTRKDYCNLHLQLGPLLQRLSYVPSWNDDVVGCLRDLMTLTC